MSLIKTDRRAWAKLSHFVQARDGFRCMLRVSPLCKGHSECTDHIVPRDLGGSDELENLQAACFPCNRYKGAGHFVPPGGEHSLSERGTDLLHRALLTSSLTKSLPNGEP